MLLSLLIVFIGFLSIQLFYFLFVYGRFAFSNPTEEKEYTPPVSIIICSKNQVDHCKILVPLLMEQDYPNFEIVLIDDASTDDTLDVFENFEAQYKNIKLVKVENIEAFWGNKKFSMTLGIKAAKYEHLLFIEPNCLPATNQWIAEMASHFDADKSIVIGYSKLIKEKKSLANMFMRFENVWQAMHTFGFTQIGKPYRGSGSNLAYHRKEFFNVRGFNDHMKIRFGEDELFVNQASTGKNTTFAISKDSFTLSKPEQNFSNWMQLKRKQLSLSKNFKSSDQIQLQLYNVSFWGFVILAAILLITQFEWEIVSSLIIARYLIAWITMGFATRKLDEKDIIFVYPLLELFWAFTLLNIKLSNLFSKPTQWR